jgi:hypothetical protein
MRLRCGYSYIKCIIDTTTRLGAVETLTQTQTQTHADTDTDRQTDRQTHFSDGNKLKIFPSINFISICQGVGLV